MVQRKPKEESTSQARIQCCYSNTAQKPKLKSFLLADSITIDDKPQVTKITDGSACGVVMGKNERSF